MANAIKLNNVSKRFGSTIAMSNICLEVPDGTVFALLGENGAGKTTAIRNILGLQSPDKGTIEVLGMNPESEGIDIRRLVGYVPDNPALYDWMTVDETGWFTGGFYPEGFVKRYESLCDQFELPPERKIKELSKGGRAKVSLALSMAHVPKLLILDEPTSGLDTIVRRKFLESMVDVAAEGRTVLLSSHQIPEVERVADYVAIIDEGQVLVSDRLDELKQQLERWVVTLESNGAALPGFDGEIMTLEGNGSRRRQLIVRKPGPNALWEMRDNPVVKEVEVHTPNLEEIFVAFINAKNQTGTGSASSRPSVRNQGGRNE